MQIKNINQYIHKDENWANNYIPKTIDGYPKFAQNLIDHIKANQANWTHIPSGDVKTLDITFQEYMKYYEITKAPCTSADIKERNRRQKESEKVLRAFVKNHLHQPPVTDKDRDEMGIPNPKTTRTQHTEVKALVKFTIVIKGTNNVIVDFKDADSVSKAKPTDCNGLIKHVIKDTALQSHEEFTHSTLVTRTPHTLEFLNEFSGKRVWVIMCLQNTRGNLGRLTEMRRR